MGAGVETFELQFRTVGFGEGGKPENPEKNPRSRKRTNDKLNAHETLSTGIVFLFI